VLDTAGAEGFYALRDLYMKKSNSVLVLYSITSRSSFAEAAEKLKQLYTANKYEYFDAQFNKPIILVGTKIDLEPSKRQVSYLEGIELAKKWNVGFIEVSAKTKTNIDTLFLTLMELFLAFGLPKKE
jgi:small GTP-binding protein